jgi:hypothetical protein
LDLDTRAIRDRNIDSIREVNLSIDIKFHRNPRLETRSRLSNPRDHESQNRQREQRNLVTPRLDRTCKHVQSSPQASDGEIHIPARNHATHILPVIFALEEIRHEIKLLRIDLDRALRKHDLAPRRAIPAAHLDWQIRDSHTR